MIYLRNLNRTKFLLGDNLLILNARQNFFKRNNLEILRKSSSTSLGFSSNSCLTVDKINSKFKQPKVYDKIIIQSNSIAKSILVR